MFKCEKWMSHEFSVIHPRQDRWHSNIFINKEILLLKEATALNNLYDCRPLLTCHQMQFCWQHHLIGRPNTMIFSFHKLTFIYTHTCVCVGNIFWICGSKLESRIIICYDYMLWIYSIFFLMLLCQGLIRWHIMWHIWIFTCFNA